MKKNFRASQMCYFVAVILGLASSMAFAAFAEEGPNPWEIYKEFKFNNHLDTWRVTDPNSSNEGAISHLPNPKLN